jgi:hypothetical protein
MHKKSRDQVFEFQLIIRSNIIFYEDKIVLYMYTHTTRAVALVVKALAAWLQPRGGWVH